MINKRVKMLIIQFSALCLLVFSCSLSQADVTLTVGKGSGTAFPNMDYPVEVSLENQYDLVTILEVDVCDVDDYLSLAPDNPPVYSCETTDRTYGFMCVTNELTENGCCRVILESLDGSVIEAGEGAIFTLNYNVKAGAPFQQCRDLIPENELILGEGSVPLNVTTESGAFCFPCTSDADCDDGLYCNGEESCVTGSCISGTDQCADMLCDERNDQCVECYGDAYCDDGEFCNGAETCVDGECQQGDVPCPDDENPCTDDCDEDTDTCYICNATSFKDLCCDDPACANEDICAGSTTTTIIPPPPPPPPPPRSCDVLLSPSSAELDSDATLQFTALTTCAGQEVEGTYIWEIVPESSMGSKINENGLFTSGDNTTDSDIDETVRVTDTAHENRSATVTVTVKVMEEAPPECEVTINPATATVSSGGTLSLNAVTTGDGCAAGDYEWSIDSEISSMIDHEGNYSAGINHTGSNETDTITVVDRANSDVSTSAIITVESKIASVLPDTLLGSRWVPLFYFLLITIEDTNLDPSAASTISFEPEDNILPIGHVVFGNVILAMIILKANPQEGTVVVTVDNGGGIVTGELTIRLLPSMFAEDCLGTPESCKEISL